MKRLLTILTLLAALALQSFGAISFTSKVHEASGAGLGSSYATASWAPTASQPVWMMVSSGITASAPPAIPTATGNGMTWVQIITATTSTNRRVTYFYAIGVGSPTTGATTIAFGGETQFYAMVDIVELTGADNTSPIVQSKTGTWTSAGANVGVTLDNGFSDTGNSSLGGVYYNSGTGGISPGTGFTELTAELTHTTPSCQQEVEWQIANDTTINWTISGSSAPKLGGGFEIKIANSSPPPPPSTITVNHLTANFDETQRTTYTTASITPVANEVTFVAVAAKKATATTQPTITGCGITWSLAKALSEFVTGRSIWVFKGVNAAPTTGTLSIAFGSNHLAAAWSVDGLTGADTTTPDVSSASNDVFGQTLTVTLPAFSNVNNATYGVTFWNFNTAVTEGSGFTEVTEQNATLFSFQVEFKSTNDTSVDWSYAGGANKNAGGIAVEVGIGTTTGNAAQWFFLSSQRRRSE